MRCTGPVTIKKNLNPVLYPDGLEVPCGKCLACRIKKRSEWALRMTLESYYWLEKSFITLTYNDENLPPNGSLQKAELQKFIKRVRKRLDEKNRKIKYFACGEYGDQTGRPHYHAIIFGLGLQEEDKEIVMQSWRKCSWDNESIRKNSFGLVESESIRYVAQYIDKKYTGDMAEREYKEKGREPVFRLCSAGIGKQYMEEYQDDIKDRLIITINGVKYSLPRYFVKKLDIPADKLSEFATNKAELLVEKFTGIECDPNVLYRIDSKEYMKYHDALTSTRKQRDHTLHGKARVKTRKL